MYNYNIKTNSKSDNEKWEGGREVERMKVWMNANVLASAHQASLHTDMLVIGGVAPCTKQEVYETASQIKEF